MLLLLVSWTAWSHKLINCKWCCWAILIKAEDKDSILTIWAEVLLAALMRLIKCLTLHAEVLEKLP